MLMATGECYLEGSMEKSAVIACLAIQIHRLEEKRRIVSLTGLPVTRPCRRQAKHVRPQPGAGQCVPDTCHSIRSKQQRSQYAYRICVSRPKTSDTTILPFI